MGKDYTLAIGYYKDDSKLEITLAITPIRWWEPDAPEELEESKAEPGQEMKFKA